MAFRNMTVALAASLLLLLVNLPTGFCKLGSFRWHKNEDVHVETELTENESSGVGSNASEPLVMMTRELDESTQLGPGHRNLAADLVNVPVPLTGHSRKATVTLSSGWSRTDKTAGVVNGNTADWIESPEIGGGECSAGSASAPYVEIDLGPGNDAFLTGAQLWHIQGRKYCGLRLEVSVDRVTWTTVYDTGTGYGPVEGTDGITVTFPRIRARYIRHRGRRNNHNGVFHVTEIKLKGLQKNYRLDVKVSQDGTRVFATVNHASFRMNGVFADGVWTGPDGGLSVTVGADNGLLFGSAWNDGLWKKPVGGAWQHIADHFEKVTVSGDASETFASQENGDVYRMTGSTWQKFEGTVTALSTNGDGSYLAGVNKGVTTSTVYIYSRALFTWQGATIPSSLTTARLIDVAMGGRNEVWVLDENYDLYHNWISYDANGYYIGPQAGGWEKMNIKMLSLGATRHGSVWGAATDGYGVLYCRDRKAEGYENRCEYIVGPGGFSRT